MCFHYKLTKKAKEIKSRFKLNEVNEEQLNQYLTSHVNGFSHKAMPIITNDKPNKLQYFHWGLIPAWIKNEQSAKDIKTKTLNARGETIFEKPSFRTAIQKQRCLVLADAFFEYQTQGKIKIPHLIQLKNNELFAFGGIWETWHNKEANTLTNTFSIVTTQANPLMAEIHNQPKHSIDKRMPLILTEKNEESWLQPQEEEVINNLIVSYDEVLMEAYPINNLQEQLKIEPTTLF